MAAAVPAQPRGILPSTISTSRQAAGGLLANKKDRHHKYGLLLQQAMGSIPGQDACGPASDPSAAMRMLEAVRLLLVFVTDMYRPSSNVQDAPVTILGQHLLTRRQLDGAANGPARTSSGFRFAERRGLTVLAQEACSFDSQLDLKDSGPHKGNTPPVVEWAVSFTPVARAQSKFLGRRQCIKVDLHGSGRLVVHKGETYSFNLPTLIFDQPLTSECLLDMKGEVELRCPQTKLSASLSFKRGHMAYGKVEHRYEGNKIASFEGSWMDRVDFQLQEMAGERERQALKSDVLYDVQQAGGLPLSALSLQCLSPMLMPRLWAAVWDALLYMDPRVASGGRAAESLALQLPSVLCRLDLERFMSSGGSRIIQAEAVEYSESDSEDDTGTSSGRALTRLQQQQPPRKVVRSVPPSYKAQKALGGRLAYHLAYSLLAAGAD